MPFIIAVVAIIAILGIGGYVMQSSSTTTATPTETVARPEEVTPTSESTATETIATPPTESPAPAGTTYTARGEYLTPARTNHIIDVTLTVADGVVTDASIIYDEGDGFSNPHQERFDGAYKAQVIGKRLDQINLSRVGGASVTSRSFNEVIDDIEAQINA